MSNLILFGSMGLAVLIGVAAIVAASREQEAYFNEKPGWDRIGSYRIPYIMMIAVGFCLVPLAGFAYAFALWAVYFSGERFK